MKASAPSVADTVHAPAISDFTTAICSSTHCLSEAKLCSGEKRMLNLAVARDGMTLPAGLPTSKEVTASVEGSK